MAKLKIPEVLTPEEQTRLLITLKDCSSCASGRNLLIVRLMLDGGLRSAEVINLRHQDIDYTTGQLMIREGKGKKDRGLWIVMDLVELIKKYVEANPGKPADLIFKSRTGKPVTSRHLRYLVKDLGKKAGLVKDIHPHTLRHSFATNLLRTTKNIVLVGKALGHANVNTTQIYTHIVDDEMQAAMQNIRQWA